MVWGAAAWKCAPRDAFVGWSPAQRRARLSLVANQLSDDNLNPA